MRSTALFEVMAIVVATMACVADDSSALGQASAYARAGPDRSAVGERASCDVSSVLAIEHVTLLPMTRGSLPIADATVIVRGQRVSWIGPSKRASVPACATTIDARRRWLIPGLVDAHVHVESPRMMRLILQDPSIPEEAINDADPYLPYIARGILQIGNMSAMSETIGQRRAIETGRVLGPHTMLAAMVDGDPSLWPVGITRVAATPEDGRQVVRDEIAEGYDMVKVYSNLTLDTFTAIVDEARSHGVKVVGHIPGRGTPIGPYFQAGYTMVAHAEELAVRVVGEEDAEVAHMVAAASLHGTGLMTTLTVDQRILEQTLDPSTLHTRPEIQYVHPVVRRFWYERNPYIGDGSAERVAELRGIIALNDKLVRAFVAAGLPVLAGTDSLVPGVVAGFALHDELAALVAAGLTPYQALEAATRAPCEWMGVAEDRGTVEVGKRADLLLLDADPLVDITNTQRIAGVVTNGRWLPRRELDAKLDELAKRYAAPSTRPLAAP
jgi:imidazolonepropionase-like amidohydrolase